MINEQANENVVHVTTTISSMSQDDNANISTQHMTPRQLVQDHQILSNNSQEDINSQDVISNFFYKPPNDYQIYDISYREISISFELVSELLGNNNNSLVQNNVQPNNLHEFYFLKVEEKKCYKVTCVLIPHSSIVEYLNKNIHGGEFNHEELQQEIYVEFSRELKENLEYYLKQFLASK
ncbi:hypothetical protein RhiirA4_476176 [Rhizophagus irregularis]|uniref:Uncharacterized protein n=1 Tax=Rhizophagus irregularis TaxID=588596 RepID=A0A2I1HB66_9GLOM|nr:hypothetical protein RhiirA4_476176 [Rhizophagus irregularis]